VNRVFSVDGIEDLTRVIRTFADDREWAQFHTVRNLVLALVGEVGELAAEVQWVPDEAVTEMLSEPQKKAAVESEIADVAIYALRLADVLGIDLEEAIRRKLVLNEQRYPVEKARGSSRKYTELGQS
jgi:dCTP diphosphatase